MHFYYPAKSLASLCLSLLNYSKDVPEKSPCTIEGARLITIILDL